MSVVPGLTPSATQPNIAQITLPPGFTLDEFYAQQRKIGTVGTMAICSVALVLWDYFALLPMEVAFYRKILKHKSWMKPTSYAFIILRYSAFFALFPGLWFTALQSEHCRAAAALSQTGVILVTAASGFIFCQRTFAIWGLSRAVIIPVTALYLVMVACWIAVVSQLHVRGGPPTTFGSNCLLGTVSAWAPLNYAASLAFDTLIVVLSVIGLRRSAKSRMVHQFLYDNVVYFFIVTVSNLFVLIVYSSKNQFLKTLVLPYPTLVTTAMGSRVYLNLWLFENEPKGPNIWGNIPMFTIGGPSTMQFSSNPAMHFRSDESEAEPKGITTEHSTDSVNTMVEGTIV